MAKYPGVRKLLIYAMNRQQLVSFILKRDNSFTETELTKKMHEQLLKLALATDKKYISKRNKKKKK